MRFSFDGQGFSWFSQSFRVDTTDQFGTRLDTCIRVIFWFVKTLIPVCGSTLHVDSACSSESTPRRLQSERSTGYVLCTRRPFVSELGQETACFDCSVLCFFFPFCLRKCLDTVLRRFTTVLLRYKPEGHWFDSRWSHWNFSVT